MPFLAGIPALLTLLGGLFMSILTFIGTYLTKRFAVVSLAIGLIITLTSAFFVALSSAAASINFVAPPWYSLAVQLVVPDNATICISAMLSARLLRFAYEWNVKFIEMKLL